jgi:hypothetical protein
MIPNLCCQRVHWNTSALGSALVAEEIHYQSEVMEDSSVI